MVWYGGVLGLLESAREILLYLLGLPAPGRTPVGAIGS